LYPKIIELGPLTLHTYGLLLALAFFSGAVILSRLVVREGLQASRAWDFAFVVIISALVGAKIFMVGSNLSYYLEHPSHFVSLGFWQAGGAYFGGLIGAIAFSYWYISRSSDLSFWVMADASGPAVALGQSIGRLGCFGAGCDYGKVTEQPWAVIFTSDYAHQKVGVPLNVSLHPVQLYESVGTFFLFLFLMWMHARRRFTGQVFAAYLIGYGVLRFFNEYFRGDRGRGILLDGAISVHQLIALTLVVISLVVIYLGKSKSSYGRA